jgi:NTE family protein
VGLVLAGGGARGAYEIGALSVLLPRLAEIFEQPEWRPQIVLGTSAGALNAAFLGARASERHDALLDEAREVWGGMSWDSVVKGPRPEVFFPLGAPASVFDTGPLWEKVLPLGLDEIGNQLRTNSNGMETVGLVTTLAATSLTRVFWDSKLDLTPENDDCRGIDYIRTDLGPKYAMASAAIPILFPAVNIPKEQGQERWYSDGGMRVNTAIAPAVALGAKKLIIIALNYPKLGEVDDNAKERQPTMFDGGLQFIQSILVDPLINDLTTIVRDETSYILVAPNTTNSIGKIASTCFKDEFGGLKSAVPPYDFVMEYLGHRLGVIGNPDRGELFSYLFFHKRFAKALMDQGRKDAERWFEKGWGNADGGPFRKGELPDFKH